MISMCTSQQKLDMRTRKIGHESQVSKDAILDRTLKNDVCETPTAKNSSAISENLAVEMRLYRFSRAYQGQAACGGGCVSGEPSNPTARNLSAIVVRCELLPELLWSQVVQRVGQTLFIEESNVIVDFLFNAGIARHMEVHEHLRLEEDLSLCPASHHTPGILTFL